MLISANFSNKVLSDRRSKILLCSAPPQSNAQEVIDIVLIQPLLKFEQGIMMHKFFKEPTMVVGLLHCVSADDIQVRELLVWRK